MKNELRKEDLFNEEYDFFDDEELNQDVFDDEYVRRLKLEKLNELDKKKELVTKIIKIEPVQEINHDIEIIKNLNIKEKLRLNKKLINDGKEPVDLNAEIIKEIKTRKVKTTKQININQTDTEILDIFNSLPVSVEKYERYIKKYKNVLHIIFQLTEGYAIVEQLKETYVREYGAMTDRSFQLIIEAGEKDNFWGAFKYNNYKVIFLKSNSYLCYSRKYRTSLDKKRITKKMLIRGSLILGLEARRIENINIPTFDGLYRVDLGNKKPIHYVLVITSCEYGNSKRINKLTSELDNIFKKEKGSITFKIISPVKLTGETEENFRRWFGLSAIAFYTSDNRYSDNLNLTDEQKEDIKNKKLILIPSAEVMNISKYFNGDITD